MGPYVLRSVNAYFKLWDASVQDSFEENLSQAPVNVIPDINSTCNCATTVEEGCGSNSLSASCPAGYMASTHTCTPLDCDYVASGTTCTPDCSCCSLTAQGCGNYPLTAQYAASGTVPPNGSPPVTGNCYFGQVLEGSLCAPGAHCPACSSSVTTGCIPAPTCINGTGAPSNCPMPICKGGTYANAYFCATGTSTAPTTGLDQNYSTSLVATCPDPPGSGVNLPGQTCQMYCAPNYVLNNSDPTKATACITPTLTGIACFNQNLGAMSGTYTGSFSTTYNSNNNNDDPGSGNILISVTCQNNTMGGVCLQACSGCLNRTGQSGQPGCSTSPNPSSISCGWDGDQTFYTHANSNPYVMTCKEGQLISINSGQVPGNSSTLGIACNWSGAAQYLQDFGSGNDMYLTCCGGIITKFEYYCGTSEGCRSVPGPGGGPISC